MQSRPVTARSPTPAPQPGRLDALPDVEWMRANLAEVFPEQLSPQALDVYGDLLNRGQHAFFGRLMAPDSELGPIIKAFHGRLYFNLAQLKRVTVIVGAKYGDTLRSLGHPERIRPEDEVRRSGRWAPCCAPCLTW